MSRHAPVKAKSAKINALYHGGMKPLLIAGHLGISLASVYRYADLPRRPPFIRVIAAEANRRIKVRKMMMGSRRFVQDFPEVREDYNPNFATDEEFIDSCMSLIGEDMTLWRDFKRSVRIRLAEKDHNRLFAGKPKSETIGPAAPSLQSLSDDETAELRRQLAKQSARKSMKMSEP